MHFGSFVDKIPNPAEPEPRVNHRDTETQRTEMNEDWVCSVSLWFSYRLNCCRGSSLFSVDTRKASEFLLTKHTK